METEHKTLSKREMQILKLVAEGYTLGMIAARFKISEKTVKNHSTNLRAKLEVYTLAQAVYQACKQGLI